MMKVSKKSILIIFAVICQRIDQIPPEDYDLWDEQRIICVYTETEEGQYLLKYTNGDLISEEGSGGMVGDPHQGMEIENGVLKVREPLNMIR